MKEGDVLRMGSSERWYTAEDAADYLAVSRPTVFRWMKQGQLSFYKVGGSTRFSKESLDAVIEKNTSQKEAETASGRCACCGHSVLIEGKVQGTGNLFFRPAKTKFWVFVEGLVPLHARTCMACGYVQMHVDTAKLTRLTEQPKEE